MTKSELNPMHGVNRSYYAFCLEQALVSIKQAQALEIAGYIGKQKELDRAVEAIAKVLMRA